MTSIQWARYVGPTRLPLRQNQVVLVLGGIDNDPEDRCACVVLVSVNNSSTCAISPGHLQSMTLAQVKMTEPREYDGGLGGAWAPDSTP